MANKNFRYPGAQPFTRDQKEIFFGREKNIKELQQLVRLEDLIVLFSKSGLGKSSLLNAGLLPLAQEKDKLEPISVRFGAFAEGNSESPLDKTKAVLGHNHPLVARIRPTNDDSLWYRLKSLQLQENIETGFLIVLDQFEELFTYPTNAIEEFGNTIAEILYTNIPDRFRDILENKLQENPNSFTTAELSKLHQPLKIKIIIAIRSDRMSLLSQLQPYLNRLLDVLYELKPLSVDQAESAILSPAYEPGIYASPNFDYTDEAVESMVSFLSDKHTESIESFQLQILCEYVENKLVIQQEKELIELSDIENPNLILENYYQDKIDAIPNPADRLAARKLIEEGLIFEEEERRLSLYEGQLLKAYDVSPALLAQLLDTHLIRSEPSMRGGYTYELSHDTLVAPVLKAKISRLSAERKIADEAERAEREAELAELKQQAEYEKTLREKAEENAHTARRRTRLSIGLSAIACLLAVLAGVSFIASRNARILAESALERFQAEQIARQKIQANFLLQDAKTYIMATEYELAIDKLEQAVKLDSTNQEVQRLLENVRNN